MELTEWYEPHIKPVRIGVYITKCDSGASWLSYWNGFAWGWGARLHSLDREHVWPSDKAGKASFQQRSWRGLKEPSNAKD